MKRTYVLQDCSNKIFFKEGSPSVICVCVCVWMCCSFAQTSPTPNNFTLPLKNHYCVGNNLIYYVYFNFYKLGLGKWEGKLKLKKKINYWHCLLALPFWFLDYFSWAEMKSRHSRTTAFWIWKESKVLKEFWSNLSLLHMGQLRPGKRKCLGQVPAGRIYRAHQRRSASLRKNSQEYVKSIFPLRFWIFSYHLS